ncbi:protein of unknown function [Xenorhabdus nematophila AN6/1]|nr:hypothetical protein XNW1_4240071 [Xenorhabdus nematophila str. Websteri]CEK25421.1 protein of unknown function [Xenorhabdus nematophila AN6/1]
MVKLDTHPNFALIWPIMLVNDSDYRLNIFLLLSYPEEKIFYGKV